MPGKSLGTSRSPAGTTGLAATASTGGNGATKRRASGLRDRSSAPHHSPNATDADIVSKIVYLRQNYHFGPLKIQMYLKRYHDIDIACSAVYRILKRLGLNRLPASQRYQRHDKRY